MTPAKAERLLSQLKAKRFGPDKIIPCAFIRFDSPSVVRLSAEEMDGLAEYYGPRGYPVIHPDVEAFATANGCFWEWENAACIALYEV